MSTSTSGRATAAPRAAQPAGLGRKRPPRAAGASGGASSAGRSIVVATSGLGPEDAGGPDEQHRYEHEENGDAVGARELRARERHVVEVELGQRLHDPDGDAA